MFSKFFRKCKKDDSLLTLDQLQIAAEVFLNPSRHGEMSGKCLSLPSWMDMELDPDSPRFLEQQLRLWEDITGRKSYNPDKNEDTPEISDLDAIYRPAFYATGNAHEAALHIIAMGHFLLRSNVRAGSRVLEYGAGFGQNALAFARLGAKVDTVDIAPGFCEAVAKNAAFFGVDMTSHRQPFGYNPAAIPGAYDLILFYESFHHCFEFKAIIPKIRDMLAPCGKIMMSGEPIYRNDEPKLLPYPWGIRLNWDNVAVMRIRGWMELGFREDYLVRQFANAGLSWKLYPEPTVHTAQIYEFCRWTAPLKLNECSMTRAEEDSWHAPSSIGRWSKETSHLGIPSRDGEIEIAISNPHPMPRAGEVIFGDQNVPFSLNPGADEILKLRQRINQQNLKLVITSNTEIGNELDRRHLGVLVESISPK